MDLNIDIDENKIKECVRECKLDRLIEEYNQLVERMGKLIFFLNTNKVTSDTREKYELLDKQLEAMEKYQLQGGTNYGYYKRSSRVSDAVK